jgi:hypothetical protein
LLESVSPQFAGGGHPRGARPTALRLVGGENLGHGVPDISCTSQNRRVISNLRNERET